MVCHVVQFPVPGNILLSVLHKSFLKIIEERNIPCLSFGETQKTPLGMKLEVTIVPPESSGTVMILEAYSPAEPSVDLDLEYIENVFTYSES